MTTITRPKPTEVEIDAPDICHSVCSDCFDDGQEPLIAICGKPEDRADLIPDGVPVQDCAICVEGMAAHWPCPTCGGLM